MVFPFGKKREQQDIPAQQSAPAYVPTDKIQRLASQGMSEPEIISRLRREGFTPSQINDALRSQIKRQVGGPQQGPREIAPRGPMQRPGTQGPPMQQAPQRGMPQPLGMGPQPGAPMPQQRGEIRMPERSGQMQGAPAPPSQQREAPRFRPPERIVAPGMGAPRRFEEPPSPQQMFTYERGAEVEEMPMQAGEITLEEVVEGIVNDKWEDFEDRLGNFEKRDIQLQGQIGDMRKKIELVEKALKDKDITFIGKLDDFGESMDSIEGRIGSIEKVFKEFIPELTENIRTMSNIVEKVKEKEQK